MLIEAGGHVIRRIARNDAGIEAIRFVAGIAGSYGYRGEGVFAKDAVMYSPAQVVCLPGGDLIFADRSKDRVRIVH